MIISRNRKIAYSAVVLASIALIHYITKAATNQTKASKPFTQMAAMQSLKCLVIPPTAKHTSTVIFMHGLGDTGSGWVSVAEMLAPNLPGTKWILPNAKIIPITCNGGMKMPGWFDILDFGNINSNEDQDGMLDSVKSINELLTAEVDSGIPADKVVLGGFSQGAVVGLLTGLTSERKVGGILSLSGYLPLRNKMRAMMSDHARKIPIFWGHGTQDPVVPYLFGQMSTELLEKDLKMESLVFKSYDMGHSANPQEIKDASLWLAERLPVE